MRTHFQVVVQWWLRCIESSAGVPVVCGDPIMTPCPHDTGPSNPGRPAPTRRGRPSPLVRTAFTVRDIPPGHVSYNYTLYTAYRALSLQFCTITPFHKCKPSPSCPQNNPTPPYVTSITTATAPQLPTTRASSTRRGRAAAATTTTTSTTTSNLNRERR